MMKKTILRVTLFATLLGAVATVPAMAGSAVIGSVAGSSNATLGGQTLLPNTTIFSGDSLQVHDGVAVISVNNNNRVIFGRDTVASFLRDGNQVTVLLSQGNVSMLHPTEGAAVRVKVGSVSITPAPGFKTLGEVAMLNGSIIVTAKDGALKLEDHGATKDVQKGQTMVLTPRTANHAGAASGGWGGGETGWHVAILGAAGVAAIFSVLAWNDAKDANTNAQNATAAGNAAESAAAAAASAAAAAASAASAAAINSECVLDLATTGTYTSPVNLGSACPGAPVGD